MYNTCKMDNINFIKNLLKQKKQINIAEFIDLALYNSDFGYYRKAKPIGKNGDFITSSEVSQIFAEVILAYFINISSLPQYICENSSGGGAKWSFVEIGSGRGTFLIDFWQKLNSLAKTNKVANSFLENLEINVVEISEELKQQQIKNFQSSDEDLFLRVKYWSSFSDFKNSVTDRQVMIFANELFDCLPLRQFVYRNNVWQEKMVAIATEISAVNFLHFVESPIDGKTAKLITEELMLQNLTPDLTISEGAVFEYSDASLSLIDDMAKLIKKNRGVALIIDYGYYDNLLINTLQAVASHKYCNPLEDIGKVDLTTLVNFFRLEILVKSHNLPTSFTTQANFLLNFGAEIRLEKLIKNSSLQKQELLKSSFARLVSSDQMGELFKVFTFWN